jgi:hypothetical protein
MTFPQVNDCLLKFQSSLCCLELNKTVLVPIREMKFKTDVSQLDLT